MIVTSEYLQRECEKEFGLKPEIARMGGLPGHSFQFRETKTELRMLSVCRIQANKRIDWILDSLAVLEAGTMPLSQRIDWRLDLAGRGALLETMVARAAELGLSDRVHFHGFVPDAELETLYDRAHMFLMPAVQGYGIPAVEALQRGIPVLLHRESGVSDLLLDTPWAEVLEGGQESMTSVLADMVNRVLSGTLREVAPPNLPTENSWAQQVAALCGYIL